MQSFKKNFSLASRSAKMVALFLLFIVLIFSVERYHRESEQVLESYRIQINCCMQAIVNEVDYHQDELLSIETENSLRNSEKISKANELLQPIFEEFIDPQGQEVLGYYSHNLETVLAVTSPSEFGNLIGKPIQATSNPHNELPEIANGKILSQTKIKDPQQQKPNGFVWAMLPEPVYKDKLFSVLQWPLVISILALLLSAFFALFLSKEIQKTTGKFEQKIKEFSQDPTRENPREDLDIPKEFHSLYQIYSDMTSKVRDLMHELSISSRIAALGDMVGVISHDLRNPLSIIKTSAELGLKADDVEKKDKNLERITRSTIEINELLEKFLTLIKSPQGNKDVVDIKQMVTDLKDVTHLLLVKKGIQFKLDISDDLPAVFADPLALRQALMNILQNAIEATPQGGEITVSAKKKTAEEIALCIADTGYGIPKEIQSKIFDRFFTTKGLQGTGLGLALAQRIVNAQKGRIWVDSTPGHGTRVYLNLPTEKTPSTKV